MKIGAIIQARMTSRRLPDKVLHEVEGKCLLQYLLERLEHGPPLSETVVATSTDASDAPIVRFCADYGVECYLGPLTDVAGRLKETAETYAMDAFVRISGDSPLLDPALVERALVLFRSGEWDLVTNVFPRTFPRGQSVEVICTDTFRKICPRIQEACDVEHVTPFYYKHANDFRIRNFEHDPRCEDVELAVDTPQNLGVFTAIVRAMKRPHWKYGLDEVVRLYRDATRQQNIEVEQ